MKKLFTFLITSLLLSQAFAGTNFLLISDPHLDPNENKTVFYNLLHDTGQDLWKASLAAMKKSVRQHPVDFAVLLGDLPAHGMSMQNKINTEKQVFSDLRKTLGNTPILYVPGNNDALGGNYHSYTENNNAMRPDQLDTAGSWPAQGLVSCNQKPNSACIIDQGPSNYADYFFGSYSVYPLKNHQLRFISLNSVPFVANPALYKNEDGLTTTATIQTLFDWLNTELADAAAKNEKVIIGMHIPPGLDAFYQRPIWNNQAVTAFNSLLSQYHNVISTVFAAHTHFEEFRFIRDAHYTQSIMVYFAPGIDPGHGNNPGFKIVNLDNQFDVNDAYVYASNTKLKFQQQFTYQDAFSSSCSKELTLHACLDKLDNDHLFYPLMQQHYALGNSGYHHWDGVEAAMHIDL